MIFELTWEFEHDLTTLVPNFFDKPRTEQPMATGAIQTVLWQA
jgi:hypothetical protein